MVNVKKLLAMILVFTMTFSHCAVVTESIASTSFVSIFGMDSNTGHKNVEFNAVLTNGENESEALVSEVNNEELALKLQLDVKESGYLKNGKVEIKAEEGEELNFVIKSDNTVAESDNVQSLEDNVLELNKIDNFQDALEITIPIEYEMEEYINETKLNNKAKVVLSGIYVDDEGEENEISQEIELTLAWKDTREVSVESEVSKYIRFGNDGVILQTIVKVDSSNPDKNSLPTKSTEIGVDVPKINGAHPTEVSVIANSTLGTNGNGVGEVEFSKDNWSYNQEENKVNIVLENSKKLVEVNKSEDFLKVEGEEVKQEERYYSVAGMDEYVLTYVFQGAELSDEMTISTNTSAKLTTFSGVQAEDLINVTTAEKANEFILEGQTGDIISYNIENETKDVSKVYAYLNKEVEYNSKTSINISYKDIVEEMIVEDVENYYVDKSGNKVQADDMYYKQISVSKENFDSILGENGKIEILDAEGNVLYTINNETQADENGNYVVNFENKVSKVTIKTSAPVNTGNLIISNKKAVSNTSVAKADYANLDSIATDTVQKAKFTYVSDLVELGNCTVNTKLNDTVTDFNLVVDRESLSTVTQNSNVEMRIELNNDEVTSDIYGNSIFEIEMPEYIKSLTITNASMIYGEGLNISNVESYIRDGKIIVKVTVVGNQTDLNSGVLTNGANIVLNADITVDMFTPSDEAVFKAYCYNSEATGYANPVEYTLGDATVVGYKEAQIEYSAPNGVVAINTVSNYNNEGSSITSIKQGEKIDYIDIYTDAKNAKMEIAVVNNNENAISNMAILGRIPFEGVKDIVSGQELGTTLDTKFVSGIVSKEGNIGDFTVYYSENKEATADLSDKANGWVSNPENLENMKSYLIVPNDADYKMEAKQVLKFEYEYEIPANLNHNENIYGTFIVSYTNNIDAMEMNEVSKADLVGLTTGAGPELEVSLKTDVNTVKENDEIKLTATVTNVGEDPAQDVMVNIPLPINTEFVSAKTNRDTVVAEKVENSVIANIGSLAQEVSVDIEVIVKVGKVYLAETSNISAKVTAKDLEAGLTTKNVSIKYEMAELSLVQFVDNEADVSYHYEKGERLNIAVYVENLTSDAKEDVTVIAKLPKELKFSKAYMIEGSAREGISEVENANYDESAHEVTWKIDEIKANGLKSLKLFVEVGDLDAGTTANLIKISSKVSAKETESYNAEDVEINVGKSSLSVTQTTSTPTYVKEGEMINYTFEIKNEGSVLATDVVLTNIIPDGIIVKEISYTLPTGENVRSMSETEKTEMTLSIPANSGVNVNVKALAASLDGAMEKTVTNEGTVASANTDKITSNSVTHIIQANETPVNEEDYAMQDNEEDTSSPVENNNTGSDNVNDVTNTDITKSYKITGTAWLDLNENGMRDDDEQRMSGVTAMVVDSSTGVIKATTTTSENGEYVFAGLQNGSYLVLFKYDTTLYTTTTYRKEGIESNINSDVVTTKIEQDGKKENGAVTDVIEVNGASVSNIDIGLVESAQFSLEIDKAITKLTVQNDEGTKTQEFDKTKLAKADITAKYLAGTKVYVEYTLTVKNNGDLAGFASEIVDYIPQGMTFNSQLNPDWYTGTDGNLYTKALADIELVSGESKEIKLVLTKQMTDESTEIVSNSAEISDDFNIYGVSDKNSKPSNKAQNEDDMSTADTILTIKTGESLIYVSGIIIGLMIGGAVAFIVYERVLKNKRKGGV